MADRATETVTISRNLQLQGIGRLHQHDVGHGQGHEHVPDQGVGDLAVGVGDLAGEDRHQGEQDEEAEGQEEEEVPGQGGHQQAGLAPEDQQIGVAAVDAGDADELEQFDDDEGGQQEGHEPADEDGHHEQRGPITNQVRARRNRSSAATLEGAALMKFARSTTISSITRQSTGRNSGSAKGLRGTGRPTPFPALDHRPRLGHLGLGLVDQGAVVVAGDGSPMPITTPPGRGTNEPLGITCSSPCRYMGTTGTWASTAM